MIRVAINGFGRIGRYVGKLILDREDMELVAVNDLAEAWELQYPLTHDTVYGRYEKDVRVQPSGLRIGDKDIQFFSKKDPEQLPWAELGIDVVVESTGVFEVRDDAARHLVAGAKSVIITAPSKRNPPSPTLLRGVNDDEVIEDDVINAASCTTNCIAPVIRVLHESFGVQSSLMTTVHAYTASQGLVDGVGGPRGRAAAANIVPTTTGAAIATTEVIPELKGKFDGVALRVPVICGSIADITAVLEKDVTVEEVNDAFVQAATLPDYQGILTVIAEPLVSSDILGNPHSAIIDPGLTLAIGNLVKVFAWYDNEAGYSHRVVELVEKLGKRAS